MRNHEIKQHKVRIMDVKKNKCKGSPTALFIKGINLDIDLKSESVILDLDCFTKLLILRFGQVFLGVGLTFANQDLNMTAVRVFSLQSLKRLT